MSTTHNKSVINRKHEHFDDEENILLKSDIFLFKIRSVPFWNKIFVCMLAMLLSFQNLTVMYTTALGRICLLFETLQWGTRRLPADDVYFSKYFNLTRRLPQITFRSPVVLHTMTANRRCLPFDVLQLCTWLLP